MTPASPSPSSPAINPKGFAGDEWFPSRVISKFKGRLYHEAREDAELRSWLEWLAESTNERSSAMGRWYLAQLANGSGLEDVSVEAEILKS